MARDRLNEGRCARAAVSSGTARRRGRSGSEDEEGAVRFGRTTLLRPDGSPTYHLASVVDDHDFEITHVVRGADHRSNTELQRELSRALGFEPPEYVHHGLLLGADGKKLSKRTGAPTIASSARRAYPRRRCARTSRSWVSPRTTSIWTSSGSAGSRSTRSRRSRTRSSPRAPARRRSWRPRCAAPATCRGASDGARDPRAPAGDAPEEAGPTLRRFVELRAAGLDGREIVRELKAVGGDLKALRLALTGAERGPELWTVIAALPEDEALRRVDAAL